MAVAAVVPLAPDEAYYRVWSHALAAGYLDHPPMVALWIRAGTAIMGETALGVRLFGPLSAALGSWLLYDAAERLFPDRQAGLTAAALLNATLLLAVGAAIMTPDTPLLLFWTATLWAAARLVAGGAPAWWLVTGLFSGLALDSKYTAAFLPIGLGLFLLIAAPRTLRRWQPWAGCAIAAALFAPVVLWNAEHAWVGFLRQGGRVADWRPARAVGFLAELVGGQIGLATPGVFVLLAAGVALAVRRAARSRDPAATLLAALSVPAILVLLQHAIGDRVQGNWPAILYPTAAVAAAALPAERWRRWLWPSCGLGFAIAALAYGHAVTGWPVLSAARDPVARLLFGWPVLGARLDAARAAAGAGFVAAEPYGLAAELAWSARDTTVLGFGSHWQPTTLPEAPAGAARGILLRPERYGAPDPSEWPAAVRLPDLVRGAAGHDIERYGVFLVTRPTPPVTLVILPRR